MRFLLSRFVVLFFSVALLALLLAGCERGGERPTVKVGYMICNSEQETLDRFLPLNNYLSERTGINFVPVLVDTHDFDDQFQAGAFDVTHTNSLLYIALREFHGLQLLVAEKRGHYGSRTAGAIIARKGSGIETMEDVRGKRLIFGPMMAPTGYLAEYDLLLRHGIDPEIDLAFYTIPRGSFKHEKVIYGVYFGEFDVAAAPVLDLEIMTREGKITADDFVILAQSPIIPYCTFGVRKDLDPKIVAALRKALLELTPEHTAEVNGERLKVLKAAWIDGFEELLDSDYDSLREMARRVNMPPYQEF